MDVDAEGVGDQPGPDDAAGGVQVEDVALPLALRILPALAVVVGVRMWIFKELDVALARAVMVGFVKALNWFFTLKTVSFRLSLVRTFS
jgi:hypothetical protein